ncbi:MULTISPECIES: RAP domain-containing protein [unclassified Endozoicomonas]|uniref:RAP domain-containing protein n=1 Tax=unclassified Endozoicomonas TaxID=2644528 RepID=UPI003BB71A22
MDRGGAGVSWQCTTSGNEYKKPDDRTDFAKNGRYRHGTVRQVNAPLPYIQKRNELHPASDACSANHSPGHSIKPDHGFNALITQEKMDWLVGVSARYSDRYDGKKHSQFATLIKQYASASQRSLNHSEQRRLIPLLHDFKTTPGWTWRSLATTFHSFTSAGVFTPHQYMDEWVKEAQADLLSTLLDPVILKCNQKPDARGINAQGTVNLLWAVAKLVDNGLALEKTAKLKEAVVALLPHVKTKAEVKEEKDCFNTQGTTNLLWALAKLVDNGLALEKTPKLKEAVAALLPQVKAKAESKAEKDRVNNQDTANLLWALAKLVDNGLKLEKTPKLKEAVAALLPHVKTKAESKQEKDHSIPQQIANLLWALAKLVDNGLALEKTTNLKEAVAALVHLVKTKAESKKEKDHFNLQEVSNLLWALAKLVDNGLELENTAKLKEAVAALVHLVKTKTESKEEKDHFRPQAVANLLWAVAKLVDNGLELEKTTKLKEVVVALLLQVKINAEAKKDHFIPQHIAILLWAVAKLVDNGLEKTAKLKEAVNALLPQVATRAESKEEKDHFKTQGIANLLWAVAKLVDNGLALGKTVMLKETVAVLLPHVKIKAESKEEKDHFNLQAVANLLWAMAKLVDNGLELEKTPKLKEAVAALLPQVKTKAESKEEKDRFKSQGTVNLLWSVVILVDNGLELEKTPKLKEALAALLYHVKTKAESKEEKDHFNPQGTAILLWALAKLGEAIELNLIKSTFDVLVDRISKTPQLSQQSILMSLWGVMVFCARFYLESGSNDKHSLEKHIGELFSRLEITSPGNEDQSIIAMAASWLGRSCPVVPDYQTFISQPQSTLCDQLQSSLPSLKIEEEKSLNSLPPVDLLLPEYNMVIDVQGPSHYVGGDFKTRNGSTLLKIALLQKSGFEVIEIPVTSLVNQDSIKIVIEQIKTKLAVPPKAYGSLLNNSGEGAEDEAYVTVDEGGEFSDDCYFTAEEYLEEPTEKTKKRNRRRKKSVKTAD